MYRRRGHRILVAVALIGVLAAPVLAASVFAARPAAAACPPAGFGAAATPSSLVEPTASVSACAVAVPFGPPPGISLRPAQVSPIPGRYNGASSGGRGSPLSLAIAGGIVLAAALGAVGLVLWLADPARRHCK